MTEKRLNLGATAQWQGSRCRQAVHLLSVDDLSRDKIEALFHAADRFKQTSVVAGNRGALSGFILVTLFFEPSTRTRFSFESAMGRLGGTVLSFSPEGTRAGSTWGEALRDTARILNGYADAVVLRHGEAAALYDFADYSRIPVINGGNGYGPGAEHPTQAILDLYTMWLEFGRIDGLRVLMLGSLQLRGARSLIKALALFDDVEVYCLCPGLGWLDDEMAAFCSENGVGLNRLECLGEVIADVDVVYHHGLSEDRGTPVPDGVRLTRSKLRHLRAEAILLHSLPRADELPFDVDDLPQARYFDQAANGVFARMAVLQRILVGKDVGAEARSGAMPVGKNRGPPDSLRQPITRRSEGHHNENLGGKT